MTSRLLIVAAILPLVMSCASEPEEGKKAARAFESIQSLKLEADSKAVIVGETSQLRALAQTSSGVVDETKACTYTSSNEKIARILPGGVVMGVWSGNVTVTATLGGIRSDPLRLQVLHAPPPMP